MIQSIGTGQAVGTSLAGRLGERPLADAALPADAAFALAILFAVHRSLSPAGQRQRGWHRRPLRGWHKTP
ncbi:hypothetical protein [Streptomyces sp. NPDC001980]|uniref:hypothetical protein n=1 Tax=Streptomyces sp. NPDC001980 TaxID=3157126 RepID=UPI00332CA112